MMERQIVVARKLNGRAVCIHNPTTGYVGTASAFRASVVRQWTTTIGAEATVDGSS
jgi:hypothetical protein